MSGLHRITGTLKDLLRGDAARLAALLRGRSREGLLPACLAAIIVGGGAYGASLGLWRAPLMALFVGIKMPLLIFLTLMVNGMINGMTAMLLGSGLSFKQTVTACLMSFALFAMITGSLSPIMICMVLDAPRAGEAGMQEWYHGFLLLNTAVIAFAGIVANHKLLRMLQAFAGDAAVGLRTLIAWLAGNLFVGAQLSYNLRPFFGNPELPVQFLRPDPFDGNFYIAVWSMSRGLLGPLLAYLIAIVAALLFFASPLLFLWLLTRILNPKPTQPK